VGSPVAEGKNLGKKAPCSVRTDGVQ
jgi:hypothetical protein